MKKHVVATLIGGLIVSQAALANSSAVLSWTGQVGSGLAHDDYMITGYNGTTASDAFEAKLVDVQSNATFTSEDIVLEIRENDGDATSPVPGILWNDASDSTTATMTVTWTVDYANTNFENVSALSLNSGVEPLVVSINGSDTAVGADYSDRTKNSVGVRVRNDTPFDPADVAGKDVAVEVGISVVGA